MARPRKEIDENLVFQLASFGLTNKEIAASCDCCADTLTRNYSELIKEGHERRNGSLRRKQYEVAMGGNAALLIWLGKQYLGQTEKVEAMGEVTVKEAIERGKKLVGASMQNGNGRTNGHL
jgi:hypothetical protein